MATIQSEQDEIIRSPQAGVLVVQGGPGTGKTVVALHRAAYLLYTHRFPLEDQGVLVIGPNRVFLRYIERVLPSLGEAGVEQVVMADLVPDVRFGGSDTALTARVKGDPRMSELIDKAVVDRQRPLREDLVVPFRSGYVRLRIDDSVRIVRAARRRFRRHNAGRRWVESEVWSAMAATWRDADVPVREVRQAVRTHARGAGRARSDVAGAHPGATAARPVRIDGVAAPRRRRAVRRTRVQGALPTTRGVGRRRAVVQLPTRRCSTTPARCSVRFLGATASSTRATRSARTATS